MTDPTKAKIIELVSEIVERGSFRCRNHSGLMRNYSEPCTCPSPSLADVLRAIQKEKGCLISFGNILGNLWLELENNRDGVKWDMTLDYDGQTQEVKEFIGKLLGV